MIWISYDQAPKDIQTISRYGMGLGEAEEAFGVQTP